MDSTRKIYVFHRKTSRTRETETYSFFVIGKNSEFLRLDDDLAALYRYRVRDGGFEVQHPLDNDPLPSLLQKLRALTGVLDLEIVKV